MRKRGNPSRNTKLGPVRLLLVVLTLGLLSFAPYVETAAAPEPGGHTLISAPLEQHTGLEGDHQHCGPTAACTPVLLSPDAEWTHDFVQRRDTPIEQTHIADMWHPAATPPIPIPVA